jgi:hypothetical protein
VGSAEDNGLERMEVRVIYRKLYDEGLRNLYNLPNIVRLVQTKKDAKDVRGIMHRESNECTRVG